MPRVLRVSVLVAACVVAALGACAKRAEPSIVEACLTAGEANLASTHALCVAAWASTRSGRVAAAGAHNASKRDDGLMLRWWVSQAPADSDGGAALLYLGQFQVKTADFTGAEVSLRRALSLQRNIQPARASNAAVGLLQLVLGREPADVSIELAELAVAQAVTSTELVALEFATLAAVEVLVDIGEISRAQLLTEKLRTKPDSGFYNLAQGHIEAANGHHVAAASHFTMGGARGALFGIAVYAGVEAARVLLADGQLAEARKRFDLLAPDFRTLAVNDASRYQAVEASLLLAEGDADAAAMVARTALIQRSRDAARVRLQNVLGDALAKLGQTAAAERAWREAADQLETWRSSISDVRMRGGLLDQHRHALEAWLESAAQRGDVETSLHIAGRMLGRGVLDRLYDGTAATAADPTVSAALAADLHTPSHRPADLRMFLLTERSGWAIEWHTAESAPTLRRLGDRDALLEATAAYLRDVDDARAAGSLGELLFPPATLVRATAIAVVLDGRLGEIALPGLRSGGRYLIEQAALLEVLAPGMLDHELPDRAWTAPLALGDPRGDLPASAREAAMVAQVLFGRQALGASATRDVLAGARNARVLHVATHSETAAGVARLVLASESVTALELLEMQLAPRLAVIATCRSSASAKPNSSLVAALIAAGTPGVVGAKASLDDDASALLIGDFYRAGGADDPVAALAVAQRQAIAEGRPPRAWAAFAFFGTGGWLQPSNGQR